MTHLLISICCLTASASAFSVAPISGIRQSSTSMSSIMDPNQFLGHASSLPNQFLGHASSLIVADTEPWVQPLALVLDPFLNLFSFAMLCRIVLSWYPTTSLREMPWILVAWPTEFLLRSIRNSVPPAFGVDITPVIDHDYFEYSMIVMVLLRPVFDTSMHMTWCVQHHSATEFSKRRLLLEVVVVRTTDGGCFLVGLGIVLSVGELVAAAILPHGDFALDPSLLPVGSVERHAAQQVSSAARKAGRWLSHEIQPELVLLSTPHGIELTNDFALYLGSQGSGYASLGQDLHNGTHRKVSLDTILLAPNETQELLRYLEPQAVSGVLSFADSEAMPLRWGEVVPLLLVDPGKPSRSRRHIILSQPLRRYTQASSMVTELLRLGKAIKEWANSRPEKIAVIISSDLAHTHRQDGPYGYSNASALFDAAIGQWAANPWLNADSLLVDAVNLQGAAKSCGFTGLVMLHGCLDGSRFESHVLANRNATYYGMLVATFIRKSPRLVMDRSKGSIEVE